VETLKVSAYVKKLGRHLLELYMIHIEGFCSCARTVESFCTSRETFESFCGCAESSLVHYGDLKKEGREQAVPF
jgi:hypothetical protein